MFIFLFTLLISIASLEEPEGYIQLNRVLFRRYVQGRAKYQPWIVVFQNNLSKKVETCTPILEELAEKSYGYFFVGKVDVKKEPVLAHNFKIKKKWTAFLFNKDGQHMINIPCDKGKYTKMLLDSLPEAVQDADQSWITSSRKKKSVILFGKKFNVPTYWRAIGAYFEDKNLRVGVCTEQDEMEKFGVKSKGTTILYLNSSGAYNIPYTSDYKALRNVIELANANKPLPPKSNDERFFLSTKFNEKCTKGKICVYHAVRSIDPRFERKEIRFTDPRIVFFSGTMEIPFKFIKEDEIWIISGDKLSGYKVNGIQELDNAIHSVLDNKTELTPFKPQDL